MTMEKTFEAAAAEAQISAAWEKAGAFRAGANASRPETFCIMIPPPNVTGSLHMGHAFNNTLQDILVRWHRMRGFDTLWQPGQDHAGIATQMVVERKLAAEGAPSRREMGREAFIDKVWEWKEESGGTIINQLKRLGASCDWDRNAFTMDETFQRAVLKVFVTLYNEGLIYRGKRLVNWDPHFETAISDLEVESIERPGHMWHFKYTLAGGETYEYVEKDADGNVTFRETRDYISIATTRPETMLGDGAVAVSPDDARYAPIVGKMVHLPLCDRLIPIITDEYPDPEFGSGAVKITGAHDFNDYQVAKRNNLPMYRLMDTRGRMRADGAPYEAAVIQARAIAAGAEASEAEIDALNLVPEKYRGMDRLIARKAVVEDITAAGLAVMVAESRTDAETGETTTEMVPFVEAKPIMQPFGDRSKVVIEPMLTDQWFVDAQTLAKPAIEAVRSGATQILPERDTKVYYHWMENIEPWCISRQLWWGHQIPVWYGPSKECLDLSEEEARALGEKGWTSFETFCAETEEEALRAAQEYYGVSVGVIDNVDERFKEQFFADVYAFSIGKPDAYVPLFRDPDVLDTWFSSGLWPFGTLGWPDQTPELARYYKTDVLVTGFDIIFFWVARMMMLGTHFMKEVPFHTVYVHALVRDEKGKKMSKSLGNVLDPLELIDEYGADAVRFTLASMAAMGRDLKLSTARIAGYRNFGTKLWNAARFAEMNGCKPAGQGIPEAQESVNRWIIGETGRIRAATDEALAAYRFNDAANGLYAHVWGVVCDWYVEFAKPLLAEGHPAREETQGVMAWVLDQCLVLLHPFMPFLTEELWGAIAARPKMLVHTDWPDYGPEIADPAADAELGWVIGLISDIRSVRAEMNVSPGAKVPLVILEADAAAEARLAGAAELIARLARVPDMPRAGAAPKGAVTLTVEGATLCLPLAEVVDVAAEKARLEKGLAKLEKEVKGLTSKLGNAAFLAKAPEEVVEEQRERLAAAETEIDKLRGALARVAEMA
ncbi:valine--tRNA ligase [Paroceanicella profunda]|uniref:Valine--tRNA ligase n=1 Tax=Paroceanicella profunda TaxID=2579971 RepID=A0A5B8FGC8_9RHOB|nr:valine--tRNA ligase [Paroceanicella profunda]QDL90708.1 valine--tRNA ligase [Paroceanicella profunda]